MRLPKSQEPPKPHTFELRDKGPTDYWGSSLSPTRVGAVFPKIFHICQPKSRGIPQPRSYSPLQDPWHPLDSWRIGRVKPYKKMRYLFHDCFMILTRCSGCDFEPVVCIQTPGFASSSTKHGPIFVYQVRIPFSTCLIRWTIKLMGPKHKPKKKSDVERSCAHVYVLNPTEILYSEVLLKKMSRYGKINLHILLENKSSNDDISQGGNQSM